MAPQIRASLALASSRLTRSRLRLGLCSLVVAAAGCASSNTTVSGPLASATPSFMLSDQQKAERNLKDPAALHLAYGRFEEQVGQTTEARKSYERALTENPHSLEAVLGLARLDQLADKPKEAEVGFQRALQMKPGDAVVMASCGQFYASQKRWPEALQMFNSAIGAAPHTAIYKHQLAVAETRAGDVNASLAVFNQLVGPEKAHYNVAYILSQEGNQAGAAQQCQAALSINPRFEPARAMLEQLQGHQVAGDPRGMNRSTAGGQVRPATMPAGNGFGPGGPGGSSQSPAPTQASWQTTESGQGTAARAVGSFDPALPRAGASGAAQSADYSSDPWAAGPAPQR
jgi:tetratricopeptide (TPR) repeat protein